MTLTFLRDKDLLVISEVEYLTVLAPATGVALTLSTQFIYNYIRRRKQFKLFRSNDRLKSPIYKVIRDTLTRLTIIKIAYLYKKVLLIFVYMNKVTVIIYRCLMRTELSLWMNTINFVTELVIVARACRILVDLSKYLLNNKTNILRTSINTFFWILHHNHRTLLTKVAFIAISLLTAGAWTHVVLLRKWIRLWTIITIFNLCSNIQVFDEESLRALQGLRAFGLPPIERTIPKFKPKTEQFKNPRLTMPGKENELALSLPLQNEMRANISKDVNIKMSEIIKDSILGEEETIVMNKRGLQKGKLSKTNSTSRRKLRMKRKRMNSLQNLNSTTNNITPLTIENNLQNLTNSTKLKEERVK